MFAFVILRGAPYVPTKRTQAEQALDVLKLKPGQIFLDLGSGDGILLKVAAERGLYAIGYELNPLLVLISRIRLRKFGEKCVVIWGDAWAGPWPEADGMYIFQLHHSMKKIEKKLHKHAYEQITQKLRVITYGFQLPKSQEIKHVDPFFLYEFHPHIANQRTRK